MTLSEGTLLGPYRILAPLGAGGMGEVYRASDTRLDRTVAIKVLPEHLSKSEEWRARFEREAKVISRLNHPNICTLHDVGREGDIHYLVMEHIEGETLAARLTRDALGLEKVLEYGIQIAQGLDKAHRAGIVHRDLKPGNVMLTKTGVKLLDFGLAKEVGASPSSLSGTSDPDAPTEQRALTTERTIVGTLHYMAPEQVTGGPVDHRADVWALGAVLYEMATGNRAFEGSTGAGVIASILEKEPPPGNIPEGLDAVMRSCLTKDADERFQSVHDVKLQLQWLSTRRSSPAETRPRRPIWVDDKELTFAASRGGQFERETILKAADGSGGETKLSSTRSHHHLGSWSPDGRMLVTDEFSENWDIYLYSGGEASGRAIVASSHLEWGPRLTSDGKWLAYASDETGQSEIYVQDFPGLTSRWQVSNGGGREPVWAQSGRELFYRNGDAMIAVSIETAPSFASAYP